jgi:hypothetical protein
MLTLRRLSLSSFMLVLVASGNIALRLSARANDR